MMNDPSNSNYSKRAINKKIEDMFKGEVSSDTPFIKKTTPTPPPKEPKEPQHQENNLLKQFFSRKGLVVFGFIVLFGWTFFFINHFSKPNFEKVQIEYYWGVDSPAPLFSSPVITDINQDGSPDVVFVDNLGFLQAIDPLAKKILYRTQLGSSVIASLNTIEVDGKEPKEILVATTDGEFFTINQQGNYLYQSREEFFSEPLYSKPVSLAKTFYLAGMEGRIWAVDSAYGEVIWVNENSPLLGQKIFSSLVYGEFDNPVLFATTEEGGMIALDARGGGLIWEKQFTSGFKSSLLLGQFIKPEMLSDLNNKSQEVYQLLASSLSGEVFILSTQGDILAKVAEPDRRHDPFISSPAKGRFNDKDVEQAVLASEGGKLFLAQVEFSQSEPTISLKISLKEIFNQPGTFISSPVVFDLNQDGFDDILIISREGNIYLLSGKDYQLLLPAYPLNFNVTSTPLVGDLDGDRHLELVIGGENGRLEILSLKTSPQAMFKKNALIYTQFLRNSINQN